MHALMQFLMGARPHAHVCMHWVLCSLLLPCPAPPQGYVFKIQGGQDKQGFAMKQGVLTNQRVRLLMTPGDQGFRGHGRRSGAWAQQLGGREGGSTAAMQQPLAQRAAWQGVNQGAGDGENGFREA